jgi:hypothetical protein
MFQTVDEGSLRYNHTTVTSDSEKEKGFQIRYRDVSFILISYQLSTKNTKHMSTRSQMIEVAQGLKSAPDGKDKNLSTRILTAYFGNQVDSAG